MSVTTIDANRNIIQTLAANDSVGVTAPLTNAATMGYVDPTGAPNKTSGTMTPFSVQTTNGSGQVTSVVTNPA